MNHDFGWWVSGLVVHIELSTVVVGLAWILTLALRQNRAAIRYWVWFAASVTFLLPFGLFARLGISMADRVQGLVGLPSRLLDGAGSLQRMSWPVLHPAGTAVTNAGATAQMRLIPLIVSAWGCGALFLIVRWSCKRSSISRAVRAGWHYGNAETVPIVVTPTLFEPGVCGVFKPVLLLPSAVFYHFPENQLKAIVAHEMCHVRRRDNLLYLVHLLIETLFWFHPLVWWIGTHLLEERERACDESTLLAGNDPEVYAQSILNICNWRLRSAPAAVAGMSGTDLKNRITRILRGETGKRLSRGRMALLTGIGVFAVILPFGVGVVSGAQARAVAGPDQAAAGDLRLEVATIKPGQPSPRGSGFFIEGRHLDVINTKLEYVFAFAYGLQRDQIVGAPEWMDKEQFDINAETEGEGQPTIAEWKEMVQNLLADRFALRFHHDERVLPVFVLMLSKGGAKLKPSAANPGAPPMVFFPGKWGTLVGRNAGTKDFAVQIQSTVLDRPVIDRTGLTGRYDFTLTWTPDESQFGHVDGARVSAASDSANSLPLFTAVQEQLGLKFESTKAPADVIVIDRIEKPGPN